MTLSNKKIKNLVKNILQFYIEKEKNNNNKIHFYAHDEWDSNQTDFEALSNERRIILKTQLTDNKDISIIFNLFQGIYDNNLWIFDEEEDFFNIESDEERKELFSNKDITIWIKYLNKRFNNDEYYECFDTIPKFELSDYSHELTQKLNCEQKVFTLNIYF